MVWVLYRGEWGGELETITSLSSKEADLLVMTVLKDLAYIENF